MIASLLFIHTPSLTRSHAVRTGQSSIYIVFQLPASVLSQKSVEGTNDQSSVNTNCHFG